MFLDLLISFYNENKVVVLMYLLMVFLLLPINAVVIPELYGRLFDSLKIIKDFPSIFDVLNNVKSQNFAGILAIISFIWFVSLLLNTMKYIYESDIAPNFQAYIRRIIYQKTLNAFSNEFQHIKTGEYLSRLMELGRNFRDLAQLGLSKILPDVLITFFIVLYMYFKSTKIANVLLISTLLCIVVQYFGTDILTNLISEKEKYFNSTLSENIQDSLDNLMNIYINNEVNTHR